MITPNDQSPSPQYANLSHLIESIRKKTNDLETIWGKRRIRVELFVQMKHFEIHSREVSVSFFLSTLMVIRRISFLLLDVVVVVVFILMS